MILLPKFVLYSNYENAYQHLIVLLRNREVRGIQNKLRIDIYLGNNEDNRSKSETISENNTDLLVFTSENIIFYHFSFFSDMYCFHRLR